MLQYELLFKRNIFVFYSLLIVNSIYGIMIALHFFNEIYPVYFYFTFGMILINACLLKFRAPNLIIQISILFTWNVSSVLLIVESNQLITFFWLVFLLIISFIYRKPLLTIVMAGLIAFQSVIILKLNFNDFLMNLAQFPYIYISFIFMLVLLSIVQFIFILKIWHYKEKKNFNFEMELSSREGYLHLFFENADDAIAVFDLDAKIIDVNPAFVKLYGWSREESIGKTLPLVPPCNLEASKDRYHRTLKGASFKLLTTQDMRKDGTLIDVQITLSPIYNRHGEIIASSVISRDISFAKEHERLVMQSEKLKVVGEMAAGLAHEIRNPLTVISGFVQMMHADEKSPYKSYTGIIDSEIERINLILSEFLVLSRPQKEIYTRFSINSVLDNIIDLFTLENEQRNIIVTKEANNIDCEIEGSENQIKQVFINLFKNSIEAIEENGHIHIELCQANNNVVIYLKDDGIGIPEHVLERIFEPFYTTKSKGTGLGMMVTKKIIHEHKGNIKIRSTEKIGTEFLISIPYVSVQNKADDRNNTYI